jgi:hypothetical protein
LAVTCLDVPQRCREPSPELFTPSTARRIAERGPMAASSASPTEADQGQPCSSETADHRTGQRRGQNRYPSGRRGDQKGPQSSGRPKEQGSGRRPSRHGAEPPLAPGPESDSEAPAQADDPP